MTWFSSIWTIAWKTALFFILWGLLLATIVPFSAKLRQPQACSPQVRLYFELIACLTILAAVWIMVAFIERRPFVTLGFVPHRFVRDLLVGFAFGTGWLVLSIAILLLAGWARVHLPLTFSGSVLAWAAGTVFLNTVAQEVLARGYIFQTIRSNSNALIAILLSSLLFVAYHAGAFKGAWLPALNVFAAGVLFGVAYQFTQNLWLPIGIHFAWNFLLGPVLGLSVSGGDPWGVGSRLLIVEGPEVFTGGAFGIEGGLVVTLCTSIGIVILLLLFPGAKLAS